ncbi:MAG TPA: hypothetical protein VGS79_26110 [Puia sp.]|nr:hypothetical protein [Puia sp.]
MNAAEDEIVESIMTCLQSSRSGIPNPSNWTAFQKDRLASLGLKSWNEVKAPQTKYCYIQLDNNLITFIPASHDNEANGAGFYLKESEAVYIKVNAARNDVYNSLQLALSRCD